MRTETYRLAFYLATLLLALPFLTGCSMLGKLSGGSFENRITCTVTKDDGWVISKYGDWFGIASIIAKRDAEKICAKQGKETT